VSLRPLFAAVESRFSHQDIPATKSPHNLDDAPTVARQSQRMGSALAADLERFAKPFTRIFRSPLRVPRWFRDLWDSRVCQVLSAGVGHTMTHSSHRAGYDFRKLRERRLN